MPHRFDDAALAGVLGHMNGDHAADNLLIARAFSRYRDAEAARMVDFDGEGGDWLVLTADGGEQSVRVPWPSGAIFERRDVRREIVALYDEACRVLGVEPRAHD
jgi:hypothetical protein